MSLGVTEDKCLFDYNYRHQSQLLLGIFNDHFCRLYCQHSHSQTDRGWSSL